MGHGNGWPSRYRDSLYPPTQNGFGLNPSAGGNDHDHQYFGEARVAKSVKLAPDAVVGTIDATQVTLEREQLLAQQNATASRGQEVV